MLSKLIRKASVEEMSISECLICKRILYNLLCLIFIIIGEVAIRSYILKTKQTLDRKGVWGRGDTCVCLAESLCCSVETITALLTGYIPIQNKKVKNKLTKEVPKSSEHLLSLLISFHSSLELFPLPHAAL